MKYLLALEEKELQPNQLPIRIRNKIEQMERLRKRLVVFEGVELSEEEQQKFNELKISINEIDEFVAEKINSFDLEVYKERMVHFEKTIKSKKLLEPKPIDPPAEEPTVQEPVVEEPKQVSEAVVGEEVIEPFELPIDGDSETEEAEVKEEAAAKEPLLEIEYAEELQDFEKASDAKPMNLSFWWLVAGACTAGLVLAVLNLVKIQQQQKK